MENKIYFGKKLRLSYFLIFLIPLFACDSNNNLPVATTQLNQALSVYDANPIIRINEDEFLGNMKFEEFKEDLTEYYGDRIIESLSEQSYKRLPTGVYEPSLMLIKDLGLKQKVTDQLSTHFEVFNEDGTKEEFLMGIREYVQDLNQYQKIASQSISEDTWIALDPDKFYLDDDENGEEIWPITFYANHISDNSRKLEVVFNEDGFLSAKENNRNKQFAVTSPNLLFIEAVTIIPCDTPILKAVNEDCGGGGSYNPPPAPPQRVNDWGRGGSTGTGTGSNTYVVLKNIRLANTGDGSGSSELQMFVKNSDNDLHNLPVSYQYRFDAVFRTHPYSDNMYVNTMIEGADKDGFANAYYEVPDINQNGIDYSFEGTPRYIKMIGGGQLVQRKDFFPLFNLTKTSGPWRFVLVDDDKDYADMSRRRHSSSYFLKDINTLDLNTGQWEVNETGFTTKSHFWGSSDDPIYESGMRRIDEDNMDLRLDNGTNGFSTTQWYGGKSFNYEIGLETYASY